MTGPRRILNLLFPPKCPFCGRVLDRPGICGACRDKLPRTEDAQREQTLGGGVRCVSPLWYEGTARDAVLRLKFGGASASAEALGGLLAQCAAELLSGEFDTVTWVPVGRRRLRARGYDQARLLAEAACRLWDTKPLPLLKKPRDNPAQSGLTGPAARRANVLGVYQAEPALTRGRRILVIDDVVTTGATLGECAGELFRAGAAAVACAALTRTPDESAEKPACRTEP